MNEDLTPEQVEQLETWAQVIRDSKHSEQDAQSDYKKVKTSLWEWIDSHLSSDDLLQHRDYFLGNASEADALSHAALAYPEYEVQQVEVNERGATVYLRENPSYRPFVYESEQYDVKIGRSVSTGAPEFDCARLLADDHELASRILTVTTTVVQRPGKSPDESVTLSFDTEAAEAEVTREPSLREVLAKYVIPGRPQCKMLPVPKKKAVKT